MSQFHDTVRSRIHNAHAALTATPTRRHVFRSAVVLFAFWLLLSLFAWLAGPALLVNWATGFVEREFGHRLVIRDVRINPLKVALTIEGLTLDDGEHGEIVAFRTMVVDVDVSSIFRAMAILDEFRLDGLTVNVERLDADRFNFTELADRLAARAAAAEAQSLAESGSPASKEASLTEEKTAAGSSAAVYFLIRSLDVSDAALRFADHTRTPVYESWMRPLNLRMQDLTSRPDREAPYNISATLGPGGTVTWEGDLSLEPLRSKGAVTLSGFGLTAAYDYVKDAFGFALPQGTLDARIDYFADFSGTQSVLRIDDGRVEVNGLAVTLLDGSPLFAFDSTAVSGVQADIMKATARVARVESRGGRVNVVLDERGVSNIERALVPRVAHAGADKPSAATSLQAEQSVITGDNTSAVRSQEKQAASEDAAPANTAWQVELARLTILDYALNFSDRSTTPDVQLNLSNVAFETGVIRLPELPAIEFTLAGTFEDRGRIGANGSYTLAGGVVDTAVTLTDLPLAPVSPYLAGIGRFSLTGGSVSWDGRVRGNQNLAQGMQVQGSAGLRDLAVRDDIRQTRLAGLRELLVDGIDYDAGSARLQVKTVTITAPDADVVVDARGVANVQRVMVPAAGQVAARPSSPSGKAASSAKIDLAKEKPLALRIGSVQLRDGRVSLRDESPDMAFSAQVSNMNARIEGLSSDPSKRASVQFDALLNKYAPLSVSGRINPLAAETFADVQLRLASLDLGTLTPYTVTWIAYPLARGQLGLELDWKVADRKFTSQNRVQIRGLALGEKQKASRAVKAPVKLGIALLTNRNGDANLDVPAFGDLDDPKFRIGSVILQALGNLVTRAATAPFAALGSLGSSKADVVEFAPGASLLTPDEQQKLGKLANTLNEKPMLTLAITGTASAESDRRALQQQTLDIQLRRAWLDENRRSGLTVDQVELDDTQRLSLLGKRFHAATGERLDALKDNSGSPLPVAARLLRAEQAVLPAIAIDDGALRELARARSQTVKDALLAGGVDQARLVVVDGLVLAGSGERVATSLALEAR